MLPRIVMVSNYINHHQLPFCNAMYGRLGDNFIFIQTEPMEEERVRMGWQIREEDVPYLRLSYSDREEAMRLIMDCDLLLAGWTEAEQMFRPRLKAGRLTLRVSERIYREGRWKFISPRGLIRKYMDHTRFRNSPAYLLCNGSYVAGDFNLIGAYPGKKYRFGYFPETRVFEDESELWEKKGIFNRVKIEHPEELPLTPPILYDRPFEIVWAGRFMELKHPEYMIKLAADLVRAGFRFHIHMIGDGELKSRMEEYAEAELVAEYITMYGYKSPEEVRDIMENCHIHVFTSNRLEGWGAVVNEGMNAGLAEVVSGEAGCADYLIEDGVNGLIYRKDRYEDMRDRVISLMEDPEYMFRLGKAAYKTIVTEWNAETAADRVIAFYEGHTNGRIDIPASGPMSEA
ncbi:MAG: glycosyltransferase family 4 protein [Lachnospiraceae bacterium]|nr:glycosyltransferase family 4 protein [Lachnospiraceae bacterium]